MSREAWGTFWEQSTWLVRLSHAGAKVHPISVSTSGLEQWTGPVTGPKDCMWNV